MIITQLTGGLGNQMFQYAFGYCLAKKNDTKLKYVFDNFNHVTSRQLELEVFQITGKQAIAEDIKRIYLDKIKISKIISIFTKKQKYIFQEKKQFFQSTNLTIPNDSYVTGYWQSEKYFLDFSDQIKKEFTFKNLLSKKNREILETINQNNSVGVHIRRGDYISNKKTYGYHGVCGLDYYQSAIEKITNKISSPVFYFFSDDPAWVKENFKTIKNSYYIDWNTGINSYCDMQLMSLCKHNIIANSSFSWWGAWLNNNKSKIVITPKKWFAKNNANTKDLIPETWLQI